MEKNSRSRGWCFTINNYTIFDLDKVSQIECDYLVYGLEEGQKKKTPHIQGYLYFNNAREFQRIKKILPETAHITKANGTPEQNKKYCTKEGHFHEVGECPKQGKRNDLQAVADALIIEKRPLNKVIEDFPVQFIKYSKGILEISKRLKPRCPKRQQRRNSFWYYGDPGAGKTSYAMDQAFLGADEDWGEVFSWGKSNGKFFNNYHGQKVAVLDDFRKGDIDFNTLLKLADPWFDCCIDVKGSDEWWDVNILFVTSVKSPYEEFGGVTEDMRQIERRFEIKRIGETHMLDLNNIPESQPLSEPISLSDLL